MDGIETPSAFRQVLNPEQLTSAIRSANFEPCQLSSGPSLSRIGRVMCPGGTCLDFAELGPAMLFTGVMPAECYSLVFVTRCPEKGRSFNFATDHVDGYMGFFPPGAEMDAFTPEGYANASLTVPAEEFHRAVARWYPEIPGKLLTNGTGMRVGIVEQARLRILLATVSEGIEDPIGPISNLTLRRELEDLLLEAFLAALRSGVGDPTPTPNFRMAGRLRHLRQARNFIREAVHEPIQLADVSDAIGMSPRGLEQLFQCSLGIGPSAFIRHQRLHGVRRSLQFVKPETGVIKEVALKWGFLHMGHFSKNYRSLFGESPSETLGRRLR